MKIHTLNYVQHETENCTTIEICKGFELNYKNKLKLLVISTVISNLEGGRRE